VLDFALGLYEAPVRDGGCADGSLAFRVDPCTRAATHTRRGFRCGWGPLPAVVNHLPSRKWRTRWARREVW